MAFAELRYFSNALVKQTEAWAIVPDVAGPWPVFYLLHGRSDDPTIWCRRTSLERYREKYPSLLIVMPNGDRSFYCDAVNGPAYESALIRDLIPFIDRTFPTRAEKAGRCIGGLSMGGYGAVKLALRYPELFVSANSHSGALNFAHDWNDNRAESARILGEALSGGPNDLYRLASEERGPVPALRIDCGTEDFILEHSRQFHAHLQKLDIAHEYAEFPGAHDWAYWDVHVQEALAFHGRALGIGSL
jgi:S-formylglutathione hydrolase FrmB